MWEIVGSDNRKEKRSYSQEATKAILHNWNGVHTQLQVIKIRTINIHNGFDIRKPRERPSVVKAYTVVKNLGTLTVKYYSPPDFRIRTIPETKSNNWFSSQWKVDVQIVYVMVSQEIFRVVNLNQQMYIEKTFPYLMQWRSSHLGWVWGSDVRNLTLVIHLLVITKRLFPIDPW